MIKVKPGASIVGLRGPMLEKLYDIDSVFEQYGVDTVITSGMERFRHSVKRSAHYRGDAVDLRSKHLKSTAQKYEVLLKLESILGDDFVVLFENEGLPQEHYHVHWGPVFEG